VLSKDLIRLYPELYHVAADGAWPSIERHGLLSTAALVTRWGVRQGAPQAAILTRRRGENIELTHPSYGTAVIRHQKAMHEPSLAGALDDLSPSEWYTMLNDRVFFFLQKNRLDELLAARLYRDDAHTVITVDTRSLVTAHEDDIELTRVNTGFAQRFDAEPRGQGSFQSIDEFAHPTRAHASTKVTDVAELAVYRGVRDITTHVKRVERVRDGTVLERFV
jgi:hypothetical protein